MNALKLFKKEQIREWDKYSIQELPIESIDLMENAAKACAEWILEHYAQQDHFTVFCGMGNNGGDGLAIARLLAYNGKSILVYILNTSDKGSPDFETNKRKAEGQKGVTLVSIHSVNDITLSIEDTVVIDAIMGTGLSRPIEGLYADCVKRINTLGQYCISIDLPSGLLCDETSIESDCIVQADVTLSFQVPKLAFLFAENHRYVGNWNLLNIGLSDAFYQSAKTDIFLLDKLFIKSLVKTISKFDHKGSNGHAMLLVGSYGKIGAAILAARAALRSGVGLLSMQVPKTGFTALQTAVPEAMVRTGEHNNTIDRPVLTDISAVGIGPGIGQDETVLEVLENVLDINEAITIFDADALNLLARNPKLLTEITKRSILTPHVGEFERLVGKSKDNFEQFKKQLEFSKLYEVYIVLKGAHTCITTPEGEAYFNNTGNPGMAKGGSGDVLTGILTGLLAQGYSPLDTTLLGVYLHGMAGDLAAAYKGEIAMTAGDIIDCIPEAYSNLLS
ncbi:MAG: NAD(P)H-hydrate dehydratase [Bacteroidia bacterium]